MFFYSFNFRILFRIFNTRRSLIPLMSIHSLFASSSFFTQNLGLSSMILLIIMGFLIGTFFSMLGLGGGMLFIPILILGFGVSSTSAIGISLFTMILVNISATISYAKEKCIDWKLAVVYDLFDIPGIIVGTWMTSMIQDSVLRLFCGIIIAALAVMIIFKQNGKKGKKAGKSDKEETHFKLTESEFFAEQIPILLSDEKKSPPILGKQTKMDYSQSWKGKNFKWVVISSFMGGLVTGMVGLGGGTMDTSSMILLGVPMNIAAGSSSLAMLLTNVVGFSGHLLLGHIIWDYALPLSFGALIGAQIGPRLHKKIHSRIMRIILAGIALISGIRLLFG